MKKEELLKLPIEELQLSSEFANTCQTMGFTCVGEIIDTGLAVIVQKKGFTYHWLGELSDFLSAEGLLYLLQPIPGNK